MHLDFSAIFVSEKEEESASTREKEHVLLFKL